MRRIVHSKVYSVNLSDDLFGVLTSVDWRVVCPRTELIWL